MDHIDIGQTLEQMAQAIRDHLQAHNIQQPVLIGIHSGGVWIAERLHEMLDIKDPMGHLDISFYRDDFTRIGINPQVKPSHLPVAVDNRHIILIDDVLYTGRTIRAALNEIFDYGRPASVALAVLLDRGGRELPIEANIVGHKIELAPGQNVKLQGPEPLSLHISQPVD